MAPIDIFGPKTLLLDPGSYIIIAILFYPCFLIYGGKVMLYLTNENGQGLVEYALILVLVAIVVIVVLSILGPQIGNVFSQINDALVRRP